MQPLKLKCGIEIHQQLEGRKLFCNCPTILRDDEPHFTIKRKLRAVAGESGEVDVAAKQEHAKDLTFIYQGYYDTTCLVETDSEPPHELNQEALYTVLQFCKLTDAKVSPIVQVMRKTVVDGSNTSGFQRTALIARGGAIKTSEGEVRISNISLEEEACKNVQESPEEEKAGLKIWRLDRLGIPLIEIGTEPDITSPLQCQEASKKIGILLRSLPGVKRGLGTIRQDVNISIAGGDRIEVKGFQELALIPTLVELEVQRQQNLIALHESLKSQLKKNKSLNTGEITDLSGVFSHTESKLIKSILEKKGKILGAKLSGFAGILGKELQPNRRFGTEMSDHAKVYGIGGMIHSDEELSKYKFSEAEIREIKQKLNIQASDAFIIIADQEEKAKKAIQAALQRAELQFIVAVPREVRKANPDATTSYMRPLPGAARMYPETDVPLIRPDLKNIQIPETLEEKFLRYQKQLGLSKDLAEFIAKSGNMLLFEELVNKHRELKPAFIAETLTSTLLEIKRNYNLDSEKLTENNFKDLFLHLSQDKIHKDIIIDVLIDMLKGTFDLKKYESLSAEKIHQVLKEIVHSNPNAPFSALMGLAVKQLGGKASGKVISEELKRIMEKGHK